MLTDAELRERVEEICAWFELTPCEFADGGRNAVLKLLGEIEPTIRTRNLLTDFELTVDIVRALKPDSRPSQQTLDRAHRAIYGLRISLG